jgi:hypothetical protein
MALKLLREFADRQKRPNNETLREAIDVLDAWNRRADTPKPYPTWEPGSNPPEGFYFVRVKGPGPDGDECWGVVVLHWLFDHTEPTLIFMGEEERRVWTDGILRGPIPTPEVKA